MKRKTGSKVEAVITKSGRIKQKKEKILVVDVLGTLYNLRVPVDTSEMDNNNSDGLTNDIGKDIQIRDLRNIYSKKDAITEMKHNIRHELLHAFVKECGLAQNDSSEVSWPVNEACIDFFALQWDKLIEVFRQGYQILDMLD